MKHCYRVFFDYEGNCQQVDVVVESPAEAQEPALAKLGGTWDKDDIVKIERIGKDVVL